MILDAEERFEEARWINRIAMGANPSEAAREYLQENSVEAERLLDRLPATEAELEEARRRFQEEAEAAAAPYWDAMKQGDLVGI